jgi:carbamoyl-phosphate synthase small subunit
VSVLHLFLRISLAYLADDLESSQCHLGAIIVRDLSLTVSNYRSRIALDEYCKQQNVIGIAGVDTRSLTKALRDTGCLVGVITTDESKTDAELLNMAKNWTIVGKDLLSVVSCTEPYEWAKGTIPEWEFAGSASKSNPFHVGISAIIKCLLFSPS